MFVVPDLRTGGAERHLVTLVPQLDRDRFETSVICIGVPGELFSVLTEAGVDATALRLTKAQAPVALVRLVAAIRSRRPDVVITRGYNAEGLGRVAAILAGVRRTVVWVHNSTEIGPRRSWFRQVSDRLLEPFTTAYFAAAQAQLDYLTREIGHPRRKIRVVHNGVDVDLFSPDATPAVEAGSGGSLGLTEGNAVVGIVAVLRPEKDHPTLLHAMRLVVDELPHARLLVVGDGPERTKLTKLTADLGLAGHVVFTGIRSDIPQLLSRCDVVTLTSTTECFPMSVLEAMATGRPTVCTAVGGIPEMVEQARTGFLVAPRDATALAERLTELLGDVDRARAMGRAGRTRVEADFSLRASTAAVERAIEEAAGMRAGEPMMLASGSPVAPVRMTAVMDELGVGGAEMLLLNLFRQLDPSVVLPRVVCMRTAGPMADDFRASGFAVEVVERTGRYDVRTVGRLVARLRADATEVVLVDHHHRAALTLGRLAARLARVPANIVAVHDMDLTRIGRRCLPRHDVETLFLSDALVLLADSQGRYLHSREGVGRRRRSSTAEFVVPNGIPVPQAPSDADRTAARAALGLGPDEIAVGVVARLTTQKAHQILLRAVARLADSRPALRLIVIGDGVRRAELQDMADDLGLAATARFLGTRRDVGALLPGLDICCLSSAHEGAPMIVIEAMAAGLPLVLTDCGAVGDMVDDGAEGFIVAVGDDAAFADRLARLADDAGLRRAMGARGRIRAVRDFRIETTARRYERVLTALVR